MIKKAIILAGGAGTRLYPVTLETPKPLLTVNRKPIINYLIELFRSHGVEEVKVIIRPQDRSEFEWWLKRWKESFGAAEISFEAEPKPMGTIGYWARHLNRWTGAEPFFLTNGDELKEVNLRDMEEWHRRESACATIALVKVPNPEEYGVAVLNEPHIIEFLEKPQKPPTNLISSGLYLIQPEALDYFSERLKAGQEFLMIEKDLFPRLAQDRKLVAYKSSGKWYDCGNLARWERAIKEWPNS
ncbi:MAG TPA: nucleotidyltransferase family protein [Candidatus Paceibacterota bacterium]